MCYFCSKLSDVACLFDPEGKNGDTVDGSLVETYERKIRNLEKENKDLMMKIHGRPFAHIRKYLVS